MGVFVSMHLWVQERVVCMCMCACVRTGVCTHLCLEAGSQLPASLLRSCQSGFLSQGPTLMHLDDWPAARPQC